MQEQRTIREYLAMQPQWRSWSCHCGLLVPPQSHGTMAIYKRENWIKLNAENVYILWKVWKAQQWVQRKKVSKFALSHMQNRPFSLLLCLINLCF